MIASPKKPTNSGLIVNHEIPCKMAELIPKLHTKVRFPFRLQHLTCKDKISGTAKRTILGDLLLVKTESNLDWSKQKGPGWTQASRP